MALNLEAGRIKPDLAQNFLNPQTIRGLIEQDRTPFLQLAPDRKTAQCSIPGTSSEPTETIRSLDLKLAREIAETIMNLTRDKT